MKKKQREWNAVQAEKAGKGRLMLYKQPVHDLTVSACTAVSAFHCSLVFYVDLSYVFPRIFK
ncbi:hypothetical protein [Geobacter sp. SVR]|uniref:hypothetical protein n=1 Tax=Geobacter sp. SVR TaxID=2495594 RepID=UPI00156381B5|nr:hypothetical protein [Geobacter sp. SVR]